MPWTEVIREAGVINGRAIALHRVELHALESVHS